MMTVVAIAINLGIGVDAPPGQRYRSGARRDDAVALTCRSSSQVFGKCSAPASFSHDFR
jgi:hypothetical protein